jgi:hypothetical protein
MEDMTTTPASGNPALEAAKAELTDIATNPSNPRHAGYHRNDPQVSAYLDTLYKKALPETPAQGTPPAPAPLREPDQAPTMTPEDRVAQAEVETMLQRTLGADYDSTMSDMRIGASHLFAGPDGANALAPLAELITALGPLAQVRGIRFLADLGKLVKTHKGG